MKLPVRSQPLIVLAAFVTIAWAGDEPGTADVRAQATELYRLSGLENQSRSIERQFVQGLEPGMAELPEDLKTVIRSVASERFASGAYVDRAITIIVTDWNPGFADSAFAWLRSDLGRRISKREEYVSTAEGEAGLTAYAVGVELSPPPEDRLMLIQRLNDAYGGTDFIVDVTIAMGVAVGMGANAASPEYQQLDLAQLRSALEVDRDQLYAEIDQFTRVFYLYTYESLTDEELGRYVEFMESDAGAWYSDVASRAFTQPVVDIGTELGVAVREYADSRKQDTEEQQL